MRPSTSSTATPCASTRSRPYPRSKHPDGTHLPAKNWPPSTPTPTNWACWPCGFLTGDQHTTNPQHLPATTPALLRQIITDTLTNQPHQRPLPEAWTYVLGHAIEQARHQKVTAAPVGTVSAPPPTPVVRSRPPGIPHPPSAHQEHRHRHLSTRRGTRPPRRLQFRATRSRPRKGSWAKVVAAGDDYHGQIGKIIEIRDDKDGFDLVLEFRGVPDSYAFRRDEVIAAAAPAEGRTRSRCAAERWRLLAKRRN